MASSERLRLALDDGTSVAAVFDAPSGAGHGSFVFAHGAGAGMDHPFMAVCAAGLVDRGIAVLRFQFPFMERGSRRVDTPAVAHAAVRAAVARASSLAPTLPLFAGGKSFGARMTSQAQAASPLAKVCGLVFVGFPLHAAGKPADERARHLAAVRLPMLFLQGTRDELADLAWLRPVLAGLGPRATLELVDDADHAFHVRAKSGRNDAQAMAAMLDATAAWMGASR